MKAIVIALSIVFASLATIGAVNFDGFIAALNHIVNVSHSLGAFMAVCVIAVFSVVLAGVTLTRIEEPLYNSNRVGKFFSSLIGAARNSWIGAFSLTAIGTAATFCSIWGLAVVACWL